ncbi:MAG TPA: YkgJ family cysteine cluster protein [Polyangiaceae bacterium]
MNAKGAEFLKFRCTGCGNCCRDPLLPLTAADVGRIQARTGDAAADIVRWVDKAGIDMDDEPEAFATLRQGKRVMVLRHENGGCRYLGDDNRCSIYTSRPLGCRVYPFDPVFTAKGKLKRLTIIKATECPHAMDGHTDPEDLRKQDERYQEAHWDYNDKVAEWNREQTRRRREGKAAQTAREFLEFLGLQ